MTLDNRLRRAREAMEALATVGNTDADAAWLAHLHDWRKTLDAELDKMPRGFGTRRSWVRRT